MINTADKEGSMLLECIEICAYMFYVYIDVCMMHYVQVCMSSKLKPFM